MMKNWVILAAPLLLAACGGSSSNSNNTPPVPAPTTPEVPTMIFEISATNLTVAQPLSPLAAFIHGSSQRIFAVGEPASAELEDLAEGGDNSSLLAAVDALVSAGGEGALPPGGSTTLTLEIQIEDSSDLSFSAVTMLVNTNDAFTAVNAADVSTLAVGESIRLRTPSYDAGTEANTESAESIPGPAGGGVGFSAERDDIADQVTMHGGAITVDDGLTGSALGQQHRWDNPVAAFTITRTQ